MLALVGSKTARPTARRWFASFGLGGGMLGLVTSTSVLDPVVVAYTLPLRRPTMRALSSVGARASVAAVPAVGAGPGGVGPAILGAVVLRAADPELRVRGVGGRALELRGVVARVVPRRPGHALVGGLPDPAVAAEVHHVGVRGRVLD